MSPQHDEAFGRLTVDEVAAKQKENAVFIYDNNPKEMFEVAHVPGARWLDSSKITPADLPGDKDATLIFYCANEH